jgi:hypothetical protein
MKRLVLLATVYSIALLSSAQDFKKLSTTVTLAVATNNWDAAKTELDKVLADPKAQSKPETYMWKAKVYASFYKSDALRAKYPDALKTADEAFQKYMQLDPSCKIISDANMTDLTFDIYSTSFNAGIRTFNNKVWDSAAFYFGTSVNYIDVIIKNKWTKATLAFDTTAILYAAYSNQNGKKMDEAYKYYARLADNKLGGKDLEDIYRFVLISTSDKKDKANFDKYLATAKEVYPKIDWDEYDLDYFTKNYSLKEKEALYAKEDAAGNISPNKYLVYGESFYNVTKEEKDKLDSAQLVELHNKARDAFKKAFQKDNQQYIAAFNTGVLYYNDYESADDAVRLNIKKLQDLNKQLSDEKDPKKKAAVTTQLKPQTDALKARNAELEKKEIEYADAAVEWFEKSYTLLSSKTTKTTQDKNLTNKTVDFLANLYQYKAGKARGKDQKAFDEYDAKYKKYDALHQ